MAKKLMTITVPGEKHVWSFEIVADDRYLKEWQEDGVEVYVLENTIPEWVVDIGLARPWCFVQDIINFKNPFGDKP